MTLYCLDSGITFIYTKKINKNKNFFEHEWKQSGALPTEGESVDVI